MNNRLDKLRTIMKAHDIDILALIPGATLRYLTGGVHYVMERPIIWFLPQDASPVAVIPKLEVPLFSRHTIIAALYPWTDAEGYDKAFKAAFEVLQPAGKTIGVEGQRMRFFEAELIRRLAVGSTVIGVDHALAELRLLKDSEEINALRQAIALSEAALHRTLETVRLGMTEIELADQLESHLKSLGSQGLSFGTILHAGGNTALPHSGPLDYRIQLGDPLLVDFGGMVGGYCADITRTVFVGEPRREHRDFYQVVQKANAAARAAAKPGVTAGSVDDAARKVLIDSGYEHLIRHRTGHGLGLESHEPPYIVQGNHQLLQPGMVFTIEPGIYDMDNIGVRIEDDVLITPDGAESLTTFPRDILVISPV